MYKVTEKPLISVYFLIATNIGFISNLRLYLPLIDPVFENIRLYMSDHSYSSVLVPLLLKYIKSKLKKTGRFKFREFVIRR